MRFNDFSRKTYRLRGGATASETPNLSVTLLTEAGSDIGAGHLTRCVALADALHELGAQPRLIVRGEAPVHLIGMHNVRILDWSDPWVLDRMCARPGAVILDSYTAPIESYKLLVREVPVCLWFDDGMRLDYPPAIVVNGSPHADKLDYRELHGAQLLLGPNYQVLRRPFWGAPNREAREHLRRVLVVFGGTDVRGLAAALAESLEAEHPDLAVDLVIEPRTAEAMRESMLAADMAISAAGQTLYELAATGTPALAVCVADNQERQAQTFAERGAIQLAGSWDDPGIISRLVRMLETYASTEERASMSDAGLSLVDGQGALRVARTVVESMRERTSV